MFPELSYFYKASLYFRYAMEDNGRYWINKPDYHDHTVQINSLGYRCNEIGEKQKLLILGDSVVFGWGVPQDKIFTTLLNKTDFEIINMGVPGSNSEEQVRMYTDEGQQLDPVLVLWIITNNDLAERSKRPTRFQKNLYRSYLITSMFYVKKRLYQIDSNEYDAQPIRKMRKLCDNLICCLYTSPERVKQDKVLYWYAEELKENKIPFFMLPDELFKDRYRNDSIDGHLNAKGHLILANTINTVLKVWEKKKSAVQ